MASGETFVFLLLGLTAGVLTTIAGQGGGLMLLLACSALIGPHEALAITAPALLLGNLHRAFILRAHIDRAVALRVIAGALPGALAGGMAAGVTPAWALRALLVGMTAIAVAKALGLLRFRVPRQVLVPAGVVIGAMTGTSGGAGVLFAPVLLSSGLTGRAFVATSSAIALSAHVGRVVGYAGLGFFSRGLVGPTIAIAVAIFAGNALGDRLRTFLTSGASRGTNGVGGAAVVVSSDSSTAAAAAILRSEKLMTTLEYATLVVCVALSVAGLG